MANNDNTCYSKKCRHFLMVVNLVKVQIATRHHIIEARKIFGNSTTRIFTRNHSDRTHLHTQIAQRRSSSNNTKIIIVSDQLPNSGDSTIRYE